MTAVLNCDNIRYGFSLLFLLSLNFMKSSEPQEAIPRPVERRHCAPFMTSSLGPASRLSSTSSSSSLFPPQQSSLPTTLVIVSWFVIIIIVTIGCRNSLVAARARDAMAFWTSPEMTQRANNDYHVRTGLSVCLLGILVFLLERQLSIAGDDRQSCLRNASRGRAIPQRGDLSLSLVSRAQPSRHFHHQ